MAKVGENVYNKLLKIVRYRNDIDRYMEQERRIRSKRDDLLTSVRTEFKGFRKEYYKPYVDILWHCRDLAEAEEIIEMLKISIAHAKRTWDEVDK